MTRRLAAGWATALLVLVVVPAARADATPPGCGPPVGTGGEWRTYGADLSNTRNQVHEQLISAADAPLLSPAWVFSSVANGGAGDFTGTPVVADGCMYVASTRGWVFAVNADTGKLVWKTQLPYGGGVNSSVAVADRTLPGSQRQTVSTAGGQSKPCRRSARRTKHKRKRCAGAKKTKKPRRGSKKRRRASVQPPRTQAGTPAPPRTAGTIYLAATRTQKFSSCPPGDPCQGPYVVALDEATGHLVWSTPPIDSQPGADVYGSPIVYDGVLMLGVSGGAAELGPVNNRATFQGSMNFIDANTGRIIKKTWTIHPPNHPADNLAGGGIWSTPAIDTQDKVAFVGAGNPFRPQAEDAHTDAVLKFDINPASSHFGNIIGSYKGNPDTYSPAFKQLPCIDTADPTNNAPPYYPQGIGSCNQIDQDFGAAPNLFTDASGRKLVGDGQKSGIYHVFDAHTMKPVWQQITGVPSSVGGIVGSAAVDGQAIYGPDTIPGYVWSLSQAQGNIRWFGPISDGAHWGPPVSYANGVVYSVDFSGFLDAFDASTGVLLAKHSLAVGGGGVPDVSWGGVSIARHTIYAGVGVLGLANGFIVAFRPGSASDLVNAVGNTTPGGGPPGGGGGGGGGAPQGPSVVAGPGAASTGYATPAIVSFAGGKLSFTNLDVVQHDVTSDDHGPDGRPLFQSKLVGLGESAVVTGTDKLQSGKSYAFYCSVHPGMRGTLVVQ
ncbi:MAG TPA: PQQ-binding-like beta-propeller repeat protein [Solirubrobacteraceae bacterium]|nr:PQQ-binding-like beta-propeller repeat protein [Solirubrobacteraceae bacterium]